jgi:cytochrome c-type biogenesis protein CcmH
VIGGGAVAQAFGVAVIAMSVAVPSSASAEPTRTSATTIEKQVMCVTCKIPLEEASSPQAEREKAYIKELVAKGLDEAQVKSDLVAEYGPAVLSLPRAAGVNLAVYIVPPAVVLIALAGLAIAIPRWRRRERDRDPGSSGAARPLSPTDAARLDRDLARFDH